MDRIEKIKKYLKLWGYSEERIKTLTSKPEYCNAIYNRIVAYEKIVLENSIQTHEQKGRKK